MWGHQVSICINIILRIIPTYNLMQYILTYVQSKFVLFDTTLDNDPKSTIPSAQNSMVS